MKKNNVKELCNNITKLIKIVECNGFDWDSFDTTNKNIEEMK